LEVPLQESSRCQYLQLFNELGYAVVQFVEALRCKPKVTGSIYVGVTGIFHCLNPSGRSMALSSTHPLTEMSTMGVSCSRKIA